MTEVIRIPMMSADYNDEFLEKNRDIVTNLVKNYNFSNVGLISQDGTPFRAVWHFNGFDNDCHISVMIRVVYNYNKKCLIIEAIKDKKFSRLVDFIPEVDF